MTADRPIKTNGVISGYTRAFFVRSAAEIDKAAALEQNVLYLCLNEASLEHCLKISKPGMLFDEDSIREEYKRINAWGFEKTFAFLERVKADAKVYAFFESNFIYLSAVFVQVLKYALVLDEFLKTHPIKDFYAFDDEKHFFSAIYGEHIKVFYPKLRFKIYPETALRVPVKSEKSSKKIIFSVLAAFSNRSARAKLKKAIAEKKRIFIASGGLNHLSGVIGRLQENPSCRVFFCENHFNLEKYRFSLKSGPGFFILPSPKQAFNPFEKESFSFAPGEITFKDVDYSGVFTALFNQFFKHGIFNFAFDYGAIAGFVEESGAEAFILDEDMAMRRLFFVLGEASGKKSFVFSHGVPGWLLNRNEAHLLGRYKSGVTFVSSDFEKGEYENIYYDPSKNPA